MAKARPASKAHTVPDEQWRNPDALWERIEPLLSLQPTHPLSYSPSRIRRIRRKSDPAVSLP